MLHLQRKQFFGCRNQELETPLRVQHAKDKLTNLYYVLLLIVLHMCT